MPNFKLSEWLKHQMLESQIEVFESLSEKFGANQEPEDAHPEISYDTKSDQLFTIIHIN